MVAEQTAGGSRGKLPPGPPVETKPAKTDHAVLAVTFEENKQKWRANGSENYHFNFRRSCFYLREYIARGSGRGRARGDLRGDLC